MKQVCEEQGYSELLWVGWKNKFLDELNSYQNFEDPLVKVKVKLSLCTTRRHMKVEEVWLHSFLTSALKGVSCPIYVLRIASTVELRNADALYRAAKERPWTANLSACCEALTFRYKFQMS
jgi:hypothetical protein